MAPITYTVLDIINDAAIEANIIAPGDDLPGDVAQWAFRKANNLLDYWSAKKNYVYTTNFEVFALVPNLSPHTIGPGGTFVQTQRPVKIVSGNVVLNNVTPNIDLPLNIRDDQWWNQNSIKALTAQFPTDLYYSANWPLGQIYFWPVPTTAYLARLELWQLLSQFEAITDPIGGPGGAGTMPPGYRNAFMLTLAQMLLPGGQKELSLSLAAAGAAARQAVFGNNTKPPRIDTADFGCPDGTTDAEIFNYKNRSFGY